MSYLRGARHRGEGFRAREEPVGSTLHHEPLRVSLRPKLCPPEEGLEPVHRIDARGCYESGLPSEALHLSPVRHGLGNAQSNPGLDVTGCQARLPGDGRLSRTLVCGQLFALGINHGMVPAC